jgi:hypothetical protein
MRVLGRGAAIAPRSGFFRHRLCSSAWSATTRADVLATVALALVHAALAWT